MTATPHCFCDLAPLYVLDLLSDKERDWVEAQAAADPDLAGELEELKQSVTAIPYGISTPPLADDLKNRLFQRLELPEPDQRDVLEPPVIPDSPPALENLGSFFSIRAEDMQWEPQPTPGIEIAWLRKDIVQREAVGVLRAGPGVQYPLHRHAGVEELFMLAGDLVDGETVYGPGDYIRSERESAHAPYTEQGCMFFFHTSMDDDYPELELATVG
jgi:hypothetical protein